MPVPSKRFFLFSLIALSSLLLGSCSGITLTDLLPGQGSTQPGETMVEVTFYVQIPLNTPDGEIIYLSLLDEVTGLGVNATAHELEPAIGEENVDQGLLYTATLLVPQGSILKYRYTRQNQYAVIEHNQIDEQVRYRLAIADSPQEIRDVVSKWSDTTYYWSDPGRISGVISDAGTGQPVPGMLVTAGGVQAFTSASGTFMLPGLPPGVHNLVVYAPDGSYSEIQQGAEVASQANTEANLTVNLRQFVDVTFLVSVPIGTPENSLRMVGNLYQLGNTFGNLPGGMNTIPARMPRLVSAGENIYGVILSLPVGAEIRYKYTLGDGFWNAEHDQNGDFHLRRLIVPDHPVQIDDQVTTWEAGEKASITIDLYTPEITPEDEEIYIQFNPYGWTTPLPMTKLGPNHWVFILFSPFDILSDLSYRYCREGQCGIADDIATPGNAPSGREARPSAEPQYIADSVDAWIWLTTVAGPDEGAPPSLEPRGEGFITGIEVMPGSQAGDSSQIVSAIAKIASSHQGWLILSPTWTFTHQNPPVIEPEPNHDPLWLDLEDLSGAVTSKGLELAYHPQPQFPMDVGQWWETAPRTFSWWNSWFDQYHAFAVHFAEAAESQGAGILILGGDWLAPALPGGKLANGEPSGVPADSDLRWGEILADVRSHYSGKIAWSMSLPGGTKPSYLDQVDQIHLKWSPPLDAGPETDLEELIAIAQGSLDGEVSSFWNSWFKDSQTQLVLSIAYPSAAEWMADCSQGGSQPCYSLDDFSVPAPNIPDLEVGFSEQSAAYQALLYSASKQDWVSGIISRGYYAPVVLLDKSISVHGKPAENLVWTWFDALR